MSIRSARIVASGAMALVLSGCAQRGVVPYRITVPSDPGSPSDAAIAAAHLDGYDVVGECATYPSSERRIVVRGQGRRQVARGAEHGWTDEMVAFRARAAAALGDLAVLVWFDPIGCRQSGPTLAAYVGAYHHYRDAIARLGTLLRDEGLGDDVEVTLFRKPPEDVGPLDRELGMPLARRPFFPYEASAVAGARHDDGWDSVLALHLGYVWGREQSASSKAGWFWGVGVDARTTAGASPNVWSVGPGVRFGRAYGQLAAQAPGPGANRGTYVYAQIGTAWSTTDRARAIVPSVGLTSLALGELIVAEYNRAGPSAYLLLLPLAALNHVEVAWEFGLDPRGVRGASVLFGFSL